MNTKQAEEYIKNCVNILKIDWQKSLLLRDTCPSKKDLNIDDDTWRSYFHLIDLYYIEHVTRMTLLLTKLPERKLRNPKHNKISLDVNSRQQVYETIELLSQQVNRIKYNRGCRKSF